MGSMISNTARTLDRDEVARFATLAGEWWDENGPFKPLHRINPVRLTYIRDQLCRHFGRDAKGPASLGGLNILDIGCGGGLVCEPLSRLGAQVTGIDPGPENIEAAKAHASAQGLDITYEVTTAEELAARGQNHDAVLLLEVVEHVPSVPAFLKTVAPLVKPGGIMILSTLNRTLKAYALAIGHLADRLRGGEPFVQSWPRHERVLSRAERFELQQLLAERGFDVGEPDGRLGGRTRSALRQFQSSVGQVPDGFASATLLERLRGR